MGVVIVGAGVVLVGWYTGIRRAAAPITGEQVVKANVAVAFVALGVALLLDPSRRSHRRIRYGIGGAAAAFGALTLVEWLTGRSLAIDEALVADRWSPAHEPSGRGAPLVVLVVMVLGLALVLWERLPRVRDVLLVAVAAVAVVPLLGHAFGVAAFIEIGDTYTVPVEASILVTILSIGAVLAAPPTGPLGRVLDLSSSSGRLTGGAAALAILIPLIGGVAFQLGVEGAGIDGATAAWLVTMTATGVALVAVLIAMGAVEHLDARFRTLLDTVPEGVYETTLDGTLLLANDPLARLLGYRDASDLVAQTERVTGFWVDVEQRSALVAQIEAGLSEGLFDAELRRRDGSTMIGELSYQAVIGSNGRPTGLRGTLRDVTAARRHQDEAARADERFRLAFHAGPLGRAMIDLHVVPRRFAAVNDRLAVMLGYTTAELIELSPESFVAPEDLEREEALIRAARVERDGVVRFDGRRRHRDGSWIPVEISGGVACDAAGRPRYAVSTVEDLRPRLAAERELDRTRGLLQNFVDNVPSPVYMLDEEGRFLLVNRQCARIIGAAPDEIVGRRRSELASFGISASEHRRNDQLVMRTGAQTVEERFGTGDDTQVYLSTKFPLIDSAGGVFGVGGVSTDITELRRLRAEAHRAWAETARRIATAVDYRDEETGAHVDRMAAYCELIATHLDHGGLDPARIRTMATLHDAGKIAIPDAILMKPDTFTAAERAVMERHATVGFELLCGTGYPDLELAASIAYTHHERWDGTGYPRGLAGLEIPLEGRIAAIADVFDALTSDRVYRRAFDVDDAVGIMTLGSGSAFDPDLLAVFLDHLDEAVAIRERYVEPRLQRSGPGGAAGSARR